MKDFYAKKDTKIKTSFQYSHTDKGSPNLKAMFLKNEPGMKAFLYNYVELVTGVFEKNLQ